MPSKRHQTHPTSFTPAVSTALGSDDLDLFVVYDANGDGKFTSNEIVGSSTTPTSNESVELAGSTVR